MRKLVQVAQGTHTWVPWEQRDSAVEAVLAARAEGCQVVAVEQTSDAVGLDRFLPRYPVCLVLGSERAGCFAGRARPRRCRHDHPDARDGQLARRGNGRGHRPARAGDSVRGRCWGQGALIYPGCSSALKARVQNLTSLSHDGSMFKQRLVTNTLCIRAEHVRAVMMRRGQVSHDGSRPTPVEAPAWWGCHSCTREFSPA